MSKTVIASVVFYAFGMSMSLQAQQTTMSFFVTSVGLGKGGDLGGLAGADRHCQSLAQAAGAGSKTWRAYLSTQGKDPVNAKDRIGNGPWFNAKGVEIASSLSDLHSENNKISKETALDENSHAVKGHDDTPNEHDMLTGTQHDGTAVPGNDDTTCSNWTRGTAGPPIPSRIGCAISRWWWLCRGGAVVGHHDLTGNPEGPNFWNYSHKTPGCALANLQRSGGAGLFYCFATN
jgi:hypothetical protein